MKLQLSRLSSSELVELVCDWWLGVSVIRPFGWSLQKAVECRVILRFHFFLRSRFHLLHCCLLNFLLHLLRGAESWLC